jgi:ubiquinone/menaquinone biosynthesis C-methylase UbiE
MFSRPLENIHQFGFMAGQKIADLGAGTGHYSYLLSEILGPQGRVYAVDIHKDNLVRLKNELNREGKRNIEIICADIEEIDGTHIKDAILDGVLMSNVLSQVKDKPSAIREAIRILKRGGRLVILEWSDKLSQEKVRELVNYENLTFERVFEAGDEHYGIIFKK